MEPTIPTKAYDLLEVAERDAVDDYIRYVENDQKFKSERIALAAQYPIPTEFVRRSKGALNKPLVRVAVREKIDDLAMEQDLSPEGVIREHAAIAHAKPSDFMEDGDFGEKTVKNFSKMPQEKLGAIKTVKIIPTAYGNRTEIVLHDKQASLKALGELMGLVSSDTPPVLGNYAGKSAEKRDISAVPERAYSNMLENMQ